MTRETVDETVGSEARHAHAHVYRDNGFRCVECGHQISKSLQHKIRNYHGPISMRDSKPRQKRRMISTRL